jgi:hypothetical protein
MLIGPAVHEETKPPLGLRKETGSRKMENAGAMQLNGNARMLEKWRSKDQSTTLSAHPHIAGSCSFSSLLQFMVGVVHDALDGV